MRFKVLGPHTINGVEPGGEFDYDEGAPGWVGEDHEGRRLEGAPFNYNAWIRSGWVEIIADDDPAPGKRGKKDEETPVS